MLKTFDITLDIEKELYHPSILLFNVSNLDYESIELDLIIKQDGKNLDLTTATVEIAIKKPSGLTVYQECEVTSAIEGKAKVLLSLQAYNEYGVYTAEVYVRETDQLAVTSPFYYSSREAIMYGEGVESVNDWSALQEVLFNLDKKPLLVDGVPLTIPEYVGQMAFDTTGRRAFISYATTAEGWQLLAAGEGGAGGGLVYWTDILGKPQIFDPAAHTHLIAEITGLQAALDLKANVGETGGGIPEDHTHLIEDVTGLQAALDGKADNADLSAYAPANHVHSWDTITNKPNTFTPAAHTHTIANVTGLQAALDGKADDADLAGKANISHTHTAANITDFAAQVAANIPAAYLTQTEGDAIYQPKGTYLTTIPAEYLTTTEGDAAYQPKGTYLTVIPAEYLTQTEGDARYAIKGEGGTGVAAAWGDIAGTLANQADLQAALDAKADDADLAGKANTTHTHTAANITDFAAGVAAAIPAAYLTETEGDTRYAAAGAAPIAHTHTIANVTGLQAELDSKLEAIPAEYLTQTEGDAAYQAKGAAPAAHTHAWADITGEPTTLAGYGITDAASDQDLLDHANYQNGEIARIDGELANKLESIPAEYLTETEGDTRYMAAGAAPTAHTHTAAQITDFAAGVAAAIPAEYLTQTEGDAAYAKTANVYSKTAVDTSLAGKANTTHTHTAAQITDFAAGVAANIPAEYLTATEGDAAYQAKGTYLTAVPLASTAAVGGGRIGNGMSMTGEYLHVKTGAGLGINAVNYALQVQTVNAAPTPLNFWTGTAADYAALTKDPNTLYFVTG